MKRDAWVDAVLGTEEIADDGDELPLGCVPYLPCAVDTLLRLVAGAQIDDRDIVVDIGAGAGRAAALIHLLTGAQVVGIEIQRHLARASSELKVRLGLSQLSMLEGDVSDLVTAFSVGSVFFLYCPFGGERLNKLVDALEPIARARPIRIGCVDIVLPARPWLRALPLPTSDLTIYSSTWLDDVER